jgi:hypothetical protein
LFFFIAVVPLVPPPSQHAVDLPADAIARIPPVNAACQKGVVTSLCMTHMRHDCHLHGIVVEAFGCRRPSDASAVLLARMLGDLLRPTGRAARVKQPDALGEPRHEFGVLFGAAFRFAVAVPCPCLGIVQALGFGALERLLLDQESLTFVPLARAAPLQDDGRERGVLAGTACQGGIAGRKKAEVIKIRAGQTEGPTIAREEDPRPPAEIFAAFIAARLAVRYEDAQVARGAVEGSAFDGHGKHSAA